MSNHGSPRAEEHLAGSQMQREMYHTDDEETPQGRSSFARATHEGGKTQSALNEEAILRDFGFSVDSLPPVNVKIAKVMTMSDVELDEQLAKFYSAVRASTDQQKLACLSTLLYWFIINSTSDRVDTTSVQEFPTGVAKKICDVWEPPARHTLRSSLRHRKLQNLAYGIASRDDSGVVRDRCRKYNVDPRFRAVFFDFFDPSSCTLASHEEQNMARTFTRVSLATSSGPKAAISRTKTGPRGGNSPSDRSSGSAREDYYDVSDRI